MPSAVATSDADSTSFRAFAHMAHPFWSRRAIGCARARGRGMDDRAAPIAAGAEAGFPDEAACGHDKGWELARERLTLQRAACGRQGSGTARTALHRRPPALSPRVPAAA